MNNLAKHPFLNEPRQVQATLERRLKEDREAAKMRHRRLGDTLLAMGLLSEREVDKIAEIQERTKQPFGKIALSQNYVKPDDVQAAIGVQFGFLREADPANPGALKIPDGLTVMRRPHSKQSEQLRLMRTRLITSCAASELKAISVIGFGMETASVGLAANLGAAFAQLHRRVLIIDSNLRQPTLKTFFDLAVGQGLVDYLSKRARYEDVVQKTLVKRLDVIADGQRAYNPQILLGSDSLDSLLKRARRDYDIVIMLSSGYGPIADGQFVWQKSDSALVVAEKHKTREDELAQLAATLYDLDTKILGSILAC